jgi:hypothetical protein
MAADHPASLHPLCLDVAAGSAELAGIRYLCSRQLQAKDGRSVLYLTEATDPRHLYKFVGSAPEGDTQSHGTLYVAALGEEGHGRWLRLAFTRPGLSGPAAIADSLDAARRAGASCFDGLFAPQARADGGHLLVCDRATPALSWREALGDAASLSFSWQGDSCGIPFATNVHHRHERPAAEPLHN